MKPSSPGFSHSRFPRGETPMLRLHAALTLMAACLCITPAHAVTINFILPVPAGEIFTAEDLPYTESGYVFTDVFGSTGHVFTFDDEGVADSYLGLGDWDPNTVTSQVRVAQEANALFSLVSIDYLHSGPGRLQFLSSKGGTLLTPEFSSSGTLNFSADPLWQDITNFTITGLVGDPDEYEFTQDEALVRSMVLVPEPATCALFVAGLAWSGHLIRRRYRCTHSARTDPHRLAPGKRNGRATHFCE